MMALLYNTDWIKQTLDVPSIPSIPPGCRTPIFIRSTREKWYERRACCGKSDLRNAIDPQNAGVIAGFADHIKGEYDEEAFNEAFMMHTTTSPSYPIVASVETAAAMLRGNPGKRLINRSVERALHFRKEVRRLRGRV